MSARIIHILETYARAYKDTGKEQPIMVIASHFNNAEILAMAEIGCQHITIRSHNLKELMETPDALPAVATTKPKHPYAELATPERLKVLSTLDPLSGSNWDGNKASMETDYISDGGAKLDQYIKQDALVSKRLQDAIDLFLDAENKIKVAIEKKIAEKGLN
ncbi:hypothetical protein Plec18167_005421 [Paecilomyces lecythidis]|uniref:Transaldolase n=1 Tax=Paecilomyces lecythidis TaxID=3004212 RepID=A0ABR3XJQ1_9EURO